MHYDEHPLTIHCNMDFNNDDNSGAEKGANEKLPEVSINDNQSLQCSRVITVCSTVKRKQLLD